MGWHHGGRGMQVEAVRTCLCLGCLWSSLQQRQCQLATAAVASRMASDELGASSCARPSITLALSNSLIRPALCRCAWVQQSTCWAVAVPCAAVRAEPDRKKVGFKRFRTFCEGLGPPPFRLSLLPSQPTRPHANRHRKSDSSPPCLVPVAVRNRDRPTTAGTA